MLQNPLVIVMGVAGSGKSTLGSALAQRLGLPFIEGDDLHPAQNRARMAQGIPLTDADRWPWLDALGESLAQTPGGAIASCSSLRRAYRDRLQSFSHQPILFLHMEAPRELLHRRISQRPGHFMPASLLDSQLALLEPPAADEYALTLDAAAPLETLLATAIKALGPRAHPA